MSSVELRNELKQAFKTFGDAARSWMDNETGQIPEEYKEWVQEKINTLIEEGLHANYPLKKAIIDYFNESYVPESDAHPSRSSGSDWFEGKVGEQIDSLMCQKTRDTIEEYNLVNTDDIHGVVCTAMGDYDNSEQINETVSDYIANMDLDSLRESITDEIDFASIINDHIGESSDFKSAIESIITGMINDQDSIKELVQPIINEVVGDFLEENIRVKDAVKSNLREILADVLR